MHKIYLTVSFQYRHSLGNVLLFKEECFTCGLEQSTNSQRVHLQHKHKIDGHISSWGKVRRAVPGDGHCIINSFALALEDIQFQGFDITTEELIARIKAEVMSNIDFYAPFVGDLDLVAELDDYLSYKRYNSSLVDLMLHVLASFTKVSILVFYVHLGNVRNVLIPPKDGPAGQMVHLAKVGQHYDAILDARTMKGTETESKLPIVHYSFSSINKINLFSKMWSKTIL